jgi:Tol biopolymer transport system component
LKSCSLIVSSLFLFTLACGDNLAAPDASITPDATPQPDAPQPDAPPDAPPPDAPPGARPPALWFHGDVIEDNRFQVVRHLHGEALPITPSVVLPGGAIATMPGNYGSGAYAPYDVNHDGTRIAFAADVNEEGRYSLYIANTDGSDAKLVVAMPTVATVQRVRFSPDGQLIAFRADYDQLGQDDVYVVPADALDAIPTRLSPDRAIVSAVLDAHDMVWSGDSTRVIMTGDFTQDDYLELWIADATAAAPNPTALVGREQIMSTNSGARGVVGPVFMTVHGKILFRTRMEADNAFKLHWVNPDGSDLEIVPNTSIMRADDSIAQIGSIGVSTSGDQIAFAADEVQSAYEIFVMPIDGSTTATRITSGTVAAARNPSPWVPLWWSPDDARIAFVADYAIDNKYEPYVVRLDGGGEVKLASIGDPNSNLQNARELAWVPDGSTIYMIADHAIDNDDSLFALDADSADQTPTAAFHVVSDGDIRGIRVTPGPPQ